MAEGIPARLSRADARRFGLLVGAAFVALGAVLSWRGHARAALICGSVGTVLVLLGAILPDTLRPVYRVWMGMAVAISKVTTPIIMGVVYFGLLTPIGLMRRLAGGNPLKPRVRNGSRWIERQAQRERAVDMEHQF